MRVLAWLVASALCCSCSVTPTERVHTAQRELGGLGPQIEERVRWYKDTAAKRIQTCEAADLKYQDERITCLGEFAPDSPLSMAMATVKDTYDLSAEGLRELEKALQVIELYYLEAHQP